MVLNSASKKSQQKKNDRLPSLSSSVTKREPKAALSPIFYWIVKNPHFTVWALYKEDVYLHTEYIFQIWSKSLGSQMLFSQYQLADFSFSKNKDIQV